MPHSGLLFILEIYSGCIAVWLTVIIGNPFVFMVIDPVKVSVRGDGLGLIKANQATSFVISAPAADIPDLDVVITGIDASLYVKGTVLMKRTP